MIIISAAVKVKHEHYEEAIDFARRHVAASRLEEGCLSHRYFEDPENERTLVFIEFWRDEAAIESHFAEPYSREFSAAFKGWCEGELGLDFHHVSKTNHVDLGA